MKELEQIIRDSLDREYFESESGKVYPPLKNIPNNLADAQKEIIKLRQACYNAYCIILHLGDAESSRKSLDNLLAASEGENFTSENWDFQYK